MDGDLRHSGFALSPASLGQLMPMYLWLDAGCRIRGAGPTLRKLLGAEFTGHALDEVFKLRNAQDAGSVVALARAQRLRMSLRAAPGTAFKAVAVPLMGEAGVLLNLSFGYGVRDAVRDHGLSATDFAGTDLAIELLYLHEAKTAVMGELTRMADRLQNAKARAEHQAATDPLTGLGNRRAMESALSQQLRSGEGFALLHLDLDYFKQVNDTLGHAAGDHVLAEVATKLRNSVRGGDLVARVGGDEFVILLAGMTERAALERVGAAIYTRMRDPILFEGQACGVALSIGAVLVAPGSSQTSSGQTVTGQTSRAQTSSEQGAEALQAMADRALYASKGAGRARMMLSADDGSVSEVARGGPVVAADRRVSS
ncbi:MAG: diguanylate cyclase domain-containing protein [Pararhodobacter sp.]